MAKERKMKGRGEMPNEEGDAVRKYKVMHEEDFWSNWLREDERSKEGKEEGKGEKRKREEEKEENEMVTG